jgi:hypothetical protein
MTNKRVNQNPLVQRGLKHCKMEVYPLVFQIALGILSFFYFATIVTYFLQRNQFPVAQRLPKVVLLEFVLFAMAGIEVLVVGSFPMHSFFANCKTYMLSVTVFENIPIIILTYRIIWILLKSYAQQKIIRGDLKEKTAGFFGRASECILKHVDFRLIPLLLLLPTAVISTVEIFLIAFNAGDVSLFSPTCASFGFTHVSVLKVCAFSPVVVLAFIASAKMKDDLSLAHEVRALLVVSALFLMGVSMLTNPDFFNFLISESRVWLAFTGIFVFPSEFVIQGMYPIMLSILHQRKQASFYKKIQNRKKIMSPNESDESILKSSTSKSQHILKKTMTLADFREELNHVLSDPLAKEMFLHFLGKEMAVENLFFIDACNDFLRKFGAHHECAGSPCPCNELIQELTNKFVSNSAPNQVNLSNKVRDALLNTVDSYLKQSSQKLSSSDDLASHLMSELEGNPFEEAQEEILKLLTTDSFLRFRMTPEYKNYLHQAQNVEVPLKTIKE